MESEYKQLSHSCISYVSIHIYSIDLNAAETGVQLKPSATPQERREPAKEQSGCSC